MTNEIFPSGFDGAVKLLPYRLRENIRKLTKDQRALAEEIRLREGRRPTVLSNGIEKPFSDEAVTKNDIDSVLDIATGASVHTVQHSMRRGYVTVRGGYRIGLGGSVIMHQDKTGGFRAVSSLAIRVPREIKGIADDLVDEIWTDSEKASVLIVSPPGGGKTTLLRDTVRVLSTKGKRISVIDERGEIAAMHSGSCQFDVGPYTDVIDGCPKAEGITMAARALNPMIIAADEITAAEDVQAIINASYCGVSFIATAHAWNENDLKNRPVYKELLSQGIFSNIVYIKRESGNFEYTAKKAVEVT